MAKARKLSTLRLRWSAFLILQLSLTASIAYGISDTAHSRNATYSYATTASSLCHTGTSAPAWPEASSRPAKKPRLITDYEFEHYWDPNMDTLRVGIILELNAAPEQRIATITRKCISAMRMAVRDVNEQQIMPGLNMSLVLRDSQEPGLGTDSGGAAAIAGVGRLIALKVGAVVGDVRSTLTHYEALMTSSVNIPQCSFASISPTLTDSVTYPYFFRTIPSTLIVLSSLLEVIELQKWRRITIIYEAETLGYLGLNRLREIVRNKGIYVLDYIPLSTPGEKFDPYFSEVERLIKASDSRIQVVLSTGPEQILLLRRMKNLGYFDNVHVWLTLNDLEEELLQEPDPESYDGLIMINSNVEMDGFGPYDRFKKEWMALNTTEYPGAGDEVLDSNEALAYTCVTMLADIYSKVIKANITNPRKISPNNPFIKELKQGRHASYVKVTEFYRNESFVGPAGPIELDRNGDRRNGNYLISSVQHGRSVDVGEVLNGTYTARIPMPFRHNSPLPDDSAPWTIQNLRWSSAAGAAFGALCIIGIAMTLATAILVIYFRDHIVIKASSPIFCICELLGILLLYVWCCLFIDIPTTRVCSARNYIPTCAITLLAGALVVKNYRIYRIFNSVTVASQSLQTRHLLVYVIATVLISIVPVIILGVVNPSKPDIVNTRNIQWATCAPTKGSQVPWYLGFAVIPTLVVLFGVFLAFSTRNVVFLWNEARQIAWVLYNNFFFLVVIIIVHTFSDDLYVATYYITIVVTYFGATFALFVLFLPKVIAIWVSMREERLKNSIGDDWGSRPHAPRGNPFLKQGSVVTDLGLSAGGGFGGQYPDTSLLGSRFRSLHHGSHNSTTFCSTESSSTNRETSIVRDSPQNNEVAPASYTWTPAPEHPLSPPLHVPLPGAVSTIGSNKASSSSISDLEKIRTNPEIVSSVSLSPVEAPSHRIGSRPSLKVPSLSDSGNPLNTWMSAQLPHKGDLGKPIFSPIGGIFHKMSISSSVIGGSGILEKSQSHQSSLREQGETIPEGGSAFPAIQPDDALELRTEEQHGAIQPQFSQVGASKVLASYCFLLPIRREGTWMTGFLSHWSMATIIVTPEVHSFLAVDSANGRSKSYLMLTMDQIRTARDPTLRITTVDSGSVLIRFSNQEYLDGWKALFSGSDLDDPVVHPPNTYGSLVSRVAKSSMVPYPNFLLQNANNNGAHPGLSSNIAHEGEASTGNRPLEPSWTPSYENGSLFNRSTQHRIWRASRADKIDTHLPITSAVPETDMGIEPRNAPPEPDNTQGQQQLQTAPPVGPVVATTLPTLELQAQQFHPLSFMSSSQQTITTAVSPTYIPTRQQEQPPLQSIAAPQSMSLFLGSTPLASPRTSRPPMSPQIAVLDPPVAQVPGPSPTVEPESNADDDDDDEDLYDPEFGFGSGSSSGRRRYQRRSLAASCTLQRSTACKLPRSSPSACDPSPSSKASTARSSMEIPSAAVLSTAATAVAAGWSEIDALSMAMEDPTGSFLHETLAGPLQARMSSNGSGNGSGSSKRGGSSTFTSTTSKMSRTSTTSSSASSFVSTPASSGKSRGSSLRHGSWSGLKMLGSGSRSPSRQPSIDELNRGTRL